MKFKIAALVVAVSIVLSGCATSNHNRGTVALEKNDLVSAERLLTMAATNGPLAERGGAYNNLGVVYMKTGRSELAISAYYMSARYGDPTGIQNLRAEGRPVPGADLLAAVEADARARQAKEETAAMLFGALMEGVAAGVAANGNRPASTTVIVNNPPPRPTYIPPTPLPRTVNCTSMVNGQWINTTCN